MPPPCYFPFRLLHLPLRLAGAAAITFALNGCSSGESAAEPRDATRAAGVAVRVVRLVPQPWAERVVVPGTLRAAERVDVAAEITGKIARIHFTEGARVRSGEVLAELDDSEPAAALAQVQRRRELAEQREQRLAGLREGGHVNAQELDLAAAEVAERRADEAVLRARLAKTRLVAPFDGVVGVRLVSEGAFVTAGQVLTTLQAVDPVRLDFAVAERYAGRVTMGQRVEFTVAGRDEVFAGEVYVAEPRVDERTRTLLVRALANNLDGRLIPGAYARVEWLASVDPDAILVPAAALQADLEAPSVWVVEAGQAATRAVRVGGRFGADVLILDGLAPGDEVIVSGAGRLRAGARVEVLAGS